MDARFSELLARQTRELDPARRKEPAPSALTVFAGWLETMWPRRPTLQFALALVLFGLGLVLGPSLAAFKDQGRQSADGNRTLAQLQEDVAGLKRMIAVSMLQQQSASERLRGVEWSQQLAAPDDQVLGALLSALNADPNVNVRLAAIEALQQFATRAAVREGLLASLPRQTSPLVQIELVQLLVELKEKSSVPVLRALLQDPQMNPTVRQEVERGLEQLT